MSRRLVDNPALWVAIGVPIIGMLMTGITVFAALSSTPPGGAEVARDVNALSRTSWRSEP